MKDDLGFVGDQSPTNSDAIRCPQSTFSTADPNLTPTAAIKHGQTGGGFQDGAPDQPAATGSSNRFSYTLNLTQCLAAKGVSFGVGDQRVFSFLGVTADGGDTAVQQLFFTRVS